MAITPDSFYERCDSESPSAGGCTVQSARWVTPYLLSGSGVGVEGNPRTGAGSGPEGDIEPQDILDAITLLLGTTSTAVGDGRLNRTPPVAHPLVDAWTVTNISSIRGRGKYEHTPAESESEVPQFPNFALYEEYEFVCEFGLRPYSIVEDDQITVTQAKWYDWNTPAGAGINYSYADEYNRYCDFEVFPKEEYITGTQGQMVFRTGSNTKPGGPTTGTCTSFAAMPRVLLPDSILQVTFYQVPYRWITSPKSFITQFKGRINQDDWIGYPKGSLLYLNWKAERFTPPVPSYTQYFDGLFDWDKLCNITFTFLYTRRISPDPPTGAQVPFPNWVPANWNVANFLNGDRNYYYITTYAGNPSNPDDPVANNPNFWFPLFYSFPIPLLFTDPDAAQPP